MALRGAASARRRPPCPEGDRIEADAAAPSSEWGECGALHRVRDLQVNEDPADAGDKGEDGPHGGHTRACWGCLDASAGDSVGVSRSSGI